MEEPDGFSTVTFGSWCVAAPCYLVNEAGRLSDPRMAGVSCQVGMPVTMHDAHSVQLALAAPTVTMLFGISPCPVLVQLAGFAMNLASDGLTVDSGICQPE